MVGQLSAVLEDPDTDPRNKCTDTVSDSTGMGMAACLGYMCVLLDPSTGDIYVFETKLI